MRKFLLLLILMIAAMPAMAQQHPLNLGFPDLDERADEVVDITLDATTLRLGAKFLRGNSEDERAVRDMIKGLQGIYVRSYEFSKEGEYDRGLVARVKSQLGPTWKPLVTVRSKTKENVNIYADVRGERIAGLVIIAAEPREFTVVSIIGDIDIERLASLEGQYGIPKISKEDDDD